jgi:predicted enzyme related to lactoylglutathione lyase
VYLACLCASGSGERTPPWLATLGNDKEGFVIDRVSSVTVQVSNQDQALDFYTSKLGFTKQSDERFGEDFRWVTVMPPGAQTQIVLAKGFAAEAAPIGKFTGIVFGAQDIQAVYEAYRSRGVTFTEPPTKQPWGGLQAQFTDQDGNGFVLVQY